MSTPTQRPTPECDRHKEQMQIEDADVAYAETLYLAIKLERDLAEARECCDKQAEMLACQAKRNAELQQQLEAMREAIREAWIEIQYAEARFAGWALRLAPNDPDTDSVLHKTGEAIRKLQPFLKTKGIIP